MARAIHRSYSDTVERVDLAATWMTQVSERDGEEGEDTTASGHR
jgi:hypothetical protein